jgi:hypothetical protein
MGRSARLLLIVENYPQLKSNENFLRLQDELAGTENRIAVERKRYNDTLQDYNTYVLQFPNSCMRGLRATSRTRRTSRLRKLRGRCRRWTLARNRQLRRQHQHRRIE